MRLRTPDRRICPLGRRISILFGALVPLFLSGCETTAGPEDPDSDPPEVVQRGDRLLGIAISDRADGDFDAAFTEASAAGMQSTGLSLGWDDLEIAQGVYAPDPDFLQIAAAYYGATGTRLMLAINPIDTNNRRVPDYLDGLAWDDPAMVAAFNALLDWALPKVEDVELVALSIGNEIDATLASQGEWAAYERFFEQVAERARTLRPGLRVGAKVTFDGLTDHAEPFAASLNGDTDVVLATWYPLADDFTILPPGTVRTVFDDLVTRYPARTILFAEIGSPSTSMCGSSEALQAEFVRQAFAAWDQHADQIELLEFVWMHDISQAALDIYESYYGISNACFLDYLATLGLQDSNGADKPGWTALVEEAALRGW